MITNKDRRLNNRYAVIDQLSVKFNEHFMEGTECSNISVGGMCIVMKEKIDRKYAYGTVFLVEKVRDEVIFFESRFRKIWESPVYVDRDDIRIGVKFLDLDPGNFDSLCKIISLQEQAGTSQLN